MTEDTSIDRRELRVVGIAAACVLAIALVRSLLGASLFDDTYYVTTALRFANGARPFAEEISLQAFGQLLSVPFVWAWQAVFGVTGIMLALRVYYCLLAAGVGAITYRLLRPTLRPAVAAVAIALPLLAPPYHLLMPTYNTMTVLAFMLGSALAFAALRDGKTGPAVWSGVLLAVGSLAHPAMAATAVVFFLTFAVMARSRRLTIGMALGGLGAAAVIAVVLFARVDLADARASLAFGTASAQGLAAPGARLLVVLGNAIRPMLSPWLVPMWMLAIVASLPGASDRVRSAALAVIPLAAAAPGAVLLMRGDHFTFGGSVASWLVTVVAGITVPSVLWARLAGERDLLRFITLAAPSGIVGAAVVAYLTNASWNRAMPVVALAPLALGLLAAWGAALVARGGVRTLYAGGGVALATVMLLLFATIWYDTPLTRPSVTIARGPYAGIRATRARDTEFRALEAAGRRFAPGGTRVAFLGEREAYLLVGGAIDTNAIWILPGPPDAAILARYDRLGRMPDVFFVDEADIAQEGGFGRAPARDPLLARILQRYRLADHVVGFSVFVPR